MAKREKKLKPDTVLKRYWNDNEQFADLFNGVLFAGEQVIQPEELEDADTEEASVFEHREYAESVKSSRDNIKIQKKSTVSGVQFVLLGLESQEHIHYAMPMRVMGYDYGCYKKQYDSNARKYKRTDVKYQAAEEMSEDEYLSRMKRTDRLTPVITVVVYYGENPWDGAKSLHGMLNIPEKMTKYVNDYKVLLVEARKNDVTLHNVNNKDLFTLLQIVLDKGMSRKEAKERALQYSEEHMTNKEVVLTVAGATNYKLNYKDLERRDGTMCTLFEEIAKDGGAKQIILMGREFGLSESDILERLQQNLNVSLQVAREYMDEFGKQTV